MSAVPGRGPGIPASPHPTLDRAYDSGVSAEIDDLRCYIELPSDDASLSESAETKRVRAGWAIWAP